MVSTKKSVGGLIILFIAALVGIVFLQATSNDIAAQTAYQITTNESLSLASVRTEGNDINQSINITLGQADDINASRPAANFVLLNATGGTIGANNYSFDVNAGRITFLNTTYLGSVIENQTYATYNYYNSNYVTDGNSRSVITLILIFFSVGLLGWIIAYLFRTDSMQNILKLGARGSVINR